MEGILYKCSKESSCPSSQVRKYCVKVLNDIVYTPTFRTGSPQACKIAMQSYSYFQKVFHIFQIWFLFTEHICDPDNTHCAPRCDSFRLASIAIIKAGLNYNMEIKMIIATINYWAYEVNKNIMYLCVCVF